MGIESESCATNYQWTLPIFKADQQVIPIRDYVIKGMAIVDWIFASLRFESANVAVTHVNIPTAG